MLHVLLFMTKDVVATSWLFSYLEKFKCMEVHFLFPCWRAAGVYLSQALFQHRLLPLKCSGTFCALYLSIHLPFRRSSVCFVHLPVWVDPSGFTRAWEMFCLTQGAHKGHILQLNMYIHSSIMTVVTNVTFHVETSHFALISLKWSRLFYFCLLYIF